jgi:hypothetical protein
MRNHLTLNVTLGINIGRHNLKTRYLNIKGLGEHKLARTLEHLIIGNFMSLEKLLLKGNMCLKMQP